jgi:hypothetical protein
VDPVDGPYLDISDTEDSDSMDFEDFTDKWFYFVSFTSPSYNSLFQTGRWDSSFDHTTWSSFYYRIVDR